MGNTFDKSSDNITDFPASCNGIKVFVKGARGAPKKIWTYSVEEVEETPSIDDITDAISQNLKIFAILESMGVSGINTAHGTLYSVTAKFEFSPGDHIITHDIDLLCPKTESDRSSQDVAFEQARELMNNIHVKAMEAITAVNTAALSTLDGLTRSTSSSMQKLGDTVSSMQGHSSLIMEANSKLVHMVFTRLDKLEANHLDLIGRVRNQKNDEQSTQMWQSILSNLMPIVIPKVANMVDNLHSLIS